MKIDRLIGILSILLQKDKITASELADKFEVSRRTIIRDIDSINRAGIPIVTMQGKNGGISIMDGFKIERTALSSDEMKAIIAGLKSLDSVSETNRYRLLMDKLGSGSSEMLNADNHILIDLSMWDKASLSPKIELIKAAIEMNEKIRFTYYAPGGISTREIEPYHLIFQWSSWYVWGFCTFRQDWRMFKLNRIAELNRTGEKRSQKDIPPYSCSGISYYQGGTKSTVQFDKSVKWRLIDEYGADSFTETKDGHIIMTFTWSDITSFYYWVLTFGEKAEILEPKQYRQEFSELLKKISARYKT